MFRPNNLNNSADKKHLILVVSDKKSNREILGSMLSESCEVLFAENGTTALQIIYERAAFLSLILLDIHMSETDGFVLLKQIKEDETLFHIPVVALSTEKNDEIVCLQRGAEDFIQEPFDQNDPIVSARITRTIFLSDIAQTVKFDRLTGLLQKEYFYQYADRFDLNRPDTATDAVVLDIVNFHLINALYGREIGNNLLIELASNLRRFARENDGIACRREGDMFLLYLKHRSSYDDLPGRLRMHIVIGDLRIPVRMRMGIYPNTDRSEDIRIRFDHAKSARDSLKGAAMIGIYDSKLQEKQIYEQRLINETEVALAEKQFKVYYQPKFRIENGTPRLTSAEALVRWDHPTLGLIPPKTFIPIFEANALVSRLDRYVWMEVAEQIGKWKKRYGRVLPVSVNVSRIDLYAPDLLDYLEKIIAQNGLSNSDLFLEITETAYAEDTEQMIATVAKLRERGFQIEMDDFGAGYSSLNMLAQMPIDFLKLDRYFIQNLDQNQKSLIILKLIMDIKDHFSISVIAEGVETEEQLKLLENMGCDIIQGFYFSPPVPPEKFSEILERDANA